MLLAIAGVSAAPRALRADIVLTFAPACIGSDAVVRATGAGDYVEAGLRIHHVPSPFTGAARSWCADSPNFAGPAMFGDPYSELILVADDRNVRLTVLSIDLANLYAGIAEARPVTVYGYFSGGGSIFQQFDLGLAATSPPAFSTFVFAPEFQNLVALGLYRDPRVGAAYQFTNVRLDLTTVPEPSALLLAATGFCALGIAARYCKQRGG